MYDREAEEMARRIGPAPILLFPLLLLALGGGLAYLLTRANPPTPDNIKIEEFSWERTRDGATSIHLVVANNNSSGVSEIEIQCTLEGPSGERLAPSEIRSDTHLWRSIRQA